MATNNKCVVSLLHIQVYFGNKVITGKLGLLSATPEKLTIEAHTDTFRLNGEVLPNYHSAILQDNDVMDIGDHTIIVKIKKDNKIY